jgi:tetratricopeptide (TPR) repeat protein
MKLAREVGDAYLEMRARAFRIVELVEAGDFDVADRDYQEFFRLADEYRQPFYQQYLSRFFGVGIALREGRFDEADEILTAVMELARRQGRVTAIVATAGQRIWLEYMRGRPENVDQTSADVTLGFLSSVPWGLAGAAATLWTLGRQEEARAAWDGMTLEDLQALGDNWVTLITLWAGSEMSYLLGDRRLASEIYERARPFAGRLIGLAGTALVYVADSFDEVLGKTSELLGRLDEAASHYQAAIDLYGRWRMRPFRAISRMRLARVLTQGTADERKRARPLLDEALSEADEIGLGHPFVAEARGLRAEL